MHSCTLFCAKVVNVTAAYDQGGTENSVGVSYKYIMYLATISLQFEQILRINICLIQTNI